MKKARAEFVKAVKDKMDTDNIGVRELARIVKVSHPTITEIVTYGNMPSFDTCIALSNWLNIPEEAGLRMSGLLKPKQTYDEWVETMNYRLNLVPEMARPYVEKMLTGIIEEPKETEGRPEPALKTKKAKAS